METAFTTPNGLKAQHLHAAKAQRETVAVVDMAGNVVAAPVNRDQEHTGLALVSFHEGRFHLTEHARRHGFVKYKDMCEGRVAGVKADPGAWRIYEHVREMKAGGAVPEEDALSQEDLYHPEVIRRRGLSRDGVQRVSAADMKKTIDSIRARGEGDDIKAAEAQAKKAGIKYADAEAPVEELIGKRRKARGNA